MIFERRKQSENPVPRDCVANHKKRAKNPTIAYRRRTRIAALRTGNIGKMGGSKKKWNMEDLEELLKEKTHRQIAFDLHRSLYAVDAKARKIRDLLKKKRSIDVLRIEAVTELDFIRKHRLTNETFRPFDDLHKRGYAKVYGI